MKLYLDNCCFNRPYDIQEQLTVRLETEAKIAIQNAILNGEHELIWSYILEYENNQNTYMDVSARILEWRGKAIQIVSETETVLDRARIIMTSGIKLMDALHISCAIEANADFFITTDKKILNKKVDDILLINPIDLVKMEVQNVQ
jgi:predicted nucleic acid-binding protein